MIIRKSSVPQTGLADQTDSSFFFEKSVEKLHCNICLVSMREGVTPVPIPNTTVKTFTADSTMRVTAWEDRWVPGIYYYSLS